MKILILYASFGWGHQRAALAIQDALKARGLSHTRASLTIARKLARRCFHTLRELGPEALEPVD